MTKTKNKIVFSYIVAIFVMILVVACNKDSNEEPYQTSTDVAVTSMSLKKDAKILTGIDSVFFSIDLQRGLIFNADSLPKGTDITRLIPVISYPSSVSSAIITMTDGDYKTGDIDYKSNPSDSVDFSGKVILKLVAQDGMTTKDYQIKVNVHKMEPDSLWWDKMAITKLPSRLENPVNQRTITFNDYVTSLIQESDGSYTISKTENPANNDWSKQRVDLNFIPDIRSFSATDNALYILDREGNLYVSNDAENWEPTGSKWLTIIGGYSEMLLGLRQDEGSIVHTHYPLLSDLSETVIEDDFPISGFSNFYTSKNKWSLAPIGIICGGETQNGTLISQTWGFDGNNWAKLSNHTPPAVKGGTLIPYYIHKQTSTMWITDEYSVCFFVGGVKSDGSLNHDLYLSYDNGVNWFVGSSLIQMPEYIPCMKNADNVIVNVKLSGNIEPKGWSAMPSHKLPSWYKLKTNINGYDVTWECPYIYLIGGEDAENNLYDTIWRGVINRLAFIPIV